MRLLVICLCLLSAGCAYQFDTPPATLVCDESDCNEDDLKRIAEGKDKASLVLNVPSKAEFRDISLAMEYDGDYLVCGRMTGINAIGGYPPMRGFVAGPETVIVEPAQDKSADGLIRIASIIDTNRFASVYRHNCGHAAAEQVRLDEGRATESVPVGE